MENFFQSNYISCRDERYGWEADKGGINRFRMQRRGCELLLFPFGKKRVQPSADHPEKGEKKHFRQSPPGREGNRNNGLHHIQSE